MQYTLALFTLVGDGRHRATTSNNTHGLRHEYYCDNGNEEWRSKSKFEVYAYINNYLDFVNAKNGTNLTATQILGRHAGVEMRGDS